MGIVTVTELEVIRRCGWAHDFGSFNRMSIESANPLKSLFIGTLWHKILDALAQKQSIELSERGLHNYVPSKRGRPGEHCELCDYNVSAHMQYPDRAIAGTYAEDIKERYKKITGREPLQLEMKDTYNTINLVREMLKGYLKYYNGLLIPEGWEYVQTEQQIFKEIPGTEHCTCYLIPLCDCSYTRKGVRKSCRYPNGYYAICKCQATCGCRQKHILEGTVDGLIQHSETGKKATLENKTFSVHPNVNEMKRTSQFTGYDWIGQDYGVEEVLYNGIWVRDHVPDGYNKAEGRKWNIHDLYLRRVISWSPAERTHWVDQLAITALNIFDPRYKPVRVVPAVGGCNGVNSCSYKTICDARFHMDKDYEMILTTQYRKRDKHDEPVSAD